MKSINQYITEFVNINNVKHYKYTPNNKKELVKAIKTELANGNTNLNCINTFNIKDMSFLFDQTDGIDLSKNQQENLDISYWDTSNVIDTYCMFYGCHFFNCDLSNWNVSKIKTMGQMFEYCERFNSDLSKWNVSNVINIAYMFYNCKQFNSDLSKWDVSKVTDMPGIFENSGLQGHEPSWYKK